MGAEGSGVGVEVNEQEGQNGGEVACEHSIILGRSGENSIKSDESLQASVSEKL